MQTNFNFSFEWITLNVQDAFPKDHSFVDLTDAFKNISDLSFMIEKEICNSTNQHIYMFFNVGYLEQQPVPCLQRKGKLRNLPI